MDSLIDVANITEEQRGIPALKWPWLGDGQDLRDDYNTYTTIADVLKRVEGKTVYAYGNGFKHYWDGEKDKAYFIAQNEVFHGAAPPGEFHKWYPNGRGGITMTEFDVQLLQLDGVSRRMSGYRLIRPEVAIICAIVNTRDDVMRYIVSNLISLAVVQAVSLSRGTSKLKCESEIINMCLPSSDHSVNMIEHVGGQISVLSAVYSKLMMRRSYADVRLGKIYLFAGLSQLNDLAASNNMYWIRHLGSERNESESSKVYKVKGVENALFFRDWLRPLRWLLTLIVVISVSIVSVVFQDVAWAEKLEKFLNLLFTATVATVIGIASVHPEKNLLLNLLYGRRRISNVLDYDMQLFTDVTRFLENEGDPGRFVSHDQSSWVSPYNHGSTILGRPVRLNELGKRKLSVSRNYELCVLHMPGGKSRNLEADSNGICRLSGPASSASGITLESSVLVA